MRSVGGENFTSRVFILLFTLRVETHGYNPLRQWNCVKCRHNKKGVIISRSRIRSLNKFKRLSNQSFAMNGVGNFILRDFKLYLF